MEAQQPPWTPPEADAAQHSEQEVAKHPEIMTPPVVEIDETDVAAEGIRLQAEKVSERSSSTTEKAEITEKELELRHEIQDDPSDEPQPVSVADVLADMPLAKTWQTEPDPVASTPEVSTIPAAPVIADDSTTRVSGGQSLTYVQAMKVGFITALLLIIGFTALQILA